MLEERHSRLAGDRPREQCLAGAGRSDQQDATGNARAERLKFVRVLQELDDFDELFLRFLDPGDIGEGDGRAIAGEEPSAALAERHCLAIVALRLAHHEDEDADQEKGGKEIAEQGEDASPTAGLLNVDLDRIGISAGVGEELEEIGIFRNARRRVSPFGVLVLDRDGERVFFLGDFGDLAGFHRSDNLGDGCFVGGVTGAVESEPDQGQRYQHAQPDYSWTVAPEDVHRQ